jgi:short-subunit dehydrogenase
MRTIVSNILGKSILITGAANGIGLELVKLMDEMNCRKLFLVDIDKQGLGKLSNQVKTSSETLVLDLSLDVFNNVNFCKIVENNEIDIIIANAGLGGVNPGDNFNEEINQKIMRVNYFGTTSIIAKILPQMIKRKSGHIVGIASLAGLRGMPQAASYSASKAAQITFLESIRLDLKPHQVKVTTVLPGFIATKMTNHDEFKMPFMLSSTSTAKKILKALEKNKNTVYFPFPINILSLFNRFLPSCIYDRLILLINPPEKKDAKIF